jgi:hypothetical protein
MSSVSVPNKGKMIMKMRELVLIAFLAASAVPASAETVSNAITANAITANAITANAITANAITSNAVTSNAMSSQAGVGSVDEVLGVELPDGKIIAK